MKKIVILSIFIFSLLSVSFAQPTKDVPNGKGENNGQGKGNGQGQGQGVPVNNVAIFLLVSALIYGVKKNMQMSNYKQL